MPRTPECSPPSPSLLTAPTCQPTTPPVWTSHLLTGLPASPLSLLIVCSLPGCQRDLLETSVRSHPSSAQNPPWLPSYFGQKPKFSPWLLSLNTPLPPPPPWAHTSLSLKPPRHRPAPGPLYLLSCHRVTWLRLLPHSLDGTYHNGSEHGHLHHRLALRTAVMSPAFFPICRTFFFSFF